MTQRTSRSTSVHSEEFTLKSQAKNVLARGTLESADPAVKAFRVFRGARAALDEAPSMPKGYSDLRARLMQEGVLVPHVDYLALSADYTFSAATAAASVFLGGSYSGNQHWRTLDGRTLGEWLTEQESTPSSRYIAPERHPTLFYLESKRKNVSATGAFRARDLATKDFMVLRGARGALDATDTMPRGYLNLRNELIGTGRLVRRTGHLELLEEYTFSAPSTAASVLLARSENGNTAWKTQDNQPLGDWLKESRITSNAEDESITESETTAIDQLPVPPYRFQLSNRKGVEASGHFVQRDVYSGEFTVLAGSTTAAKQGTSMSIRRADLYDELLAEGTIVTSQGNPRFERDCTFESAGIATEILCRRSCSEGREWQDDAGNWLKDLRSKQRKRPGKQGAVDSRSNIVIDAEKMLSDDATGTATSSRPLSPAPVSSQAVTSDTCAPGEPDQEDSEERLKEEDTAEHSAATALSRLARRNAF